MFQKVVFSSPLGLTSPLHCGEVVNVSSYKYVARKGKRLERLSLSEQTELLDDLIEAFTHLKSREEVAAFMVDLMTGAEVKNFSKRLRIAKLLLAGKDYDSIRKLVKVSFATIAKVSGWLGGRKTVIKSVVERLPQKKKFKHWTDFDNWDRFKRSHPAMFWPVFATENLEKSVEEGKHESLKGVLGNLSAKDSFNREIKEEFGEEVRNRH